MAKKSSNRLASNLEQLVSRVENIYEQRGSELDQVSGVLGNMDKLVEIMAKVELQREAEEQLDRRLAKLNKLVEKLSIQEEVQSRDLSVEDTVRKVIKGVKVTGRIMDIVAGSLGVMLDSISTTVKSGEAQSSTRSANQTKEPVDLAAVLSPLGGLLQGLFGENNEVVKAKQDEKLEE
ncbi:hypothetical protein [Desulforamulus aquiferis]|uniref:DUF1641 domain-containing protein n=1 Tax=Desulforamulus aquiferis TaxID=1397668 RepID=A0AAW7ZFI1_9FIRM|nr:hypothetical protein [Desulforamulus aquiferis]MDO7788079.1 hypothetical protein [Desulforamulus aquiferis]